MSEVFFTNFRSRPGRSLPKKMELLVKAAGIGTLDCKDKFTAIKIHFGELGNMAFLRHNYASRMAELLRQMGARTFLTDTNTLYSGSRSNAVDHLRTAYLIWRGVEKYRDGMCQRCREIAFAFRFTAGH